ncbi:TIGR03862 family flavoprotein [Oryzibacter oryziterrae]|uniref:TIGR03862 family flavoprotein n=1 Tax=Oryzibacter oryziterrae TaxID=2766474 RepID=UPI001F37DEFA|nr:TIGR03862 family flavoprotein [Oryzibacter oryziterrae]
MQKQVAIIGGGPAGLMAAEVLSSAGVSVTLYEAMPTIGRKLLLAGKSGLNLTHSEDYETFIGRYGAAVPRLKPALDAFTPDDLRRWAGSLGIDTFVGSSGRVFPTSMKASPLLRAWLKRLAAQGVQLETRHRWCGFSGDALLFAAPDGPKEIRPDATLIALGGASYPRLGSDAAWVPWLRERGVAVHAFRPANCGFNAHWPEAFAERHAGAWVKSVTATSAAGTLPGEFVVSRNGVEGSLVYAHSAASRDAIERDGSATLLVDLLPGRSLERVADDLARQSPKSSFSNRLRKATGLQGVKGALASLLIAPITRADPPALAAALKALPLPLVSPRPVEEAISVAGGIAWGEVDADYSLTKLPGLFVAGEMIDWEAPTGGYLITACLATGRAAAKGILARLADKT